MLTNSVGVPGFFHAQSPDPRRYRSRFHNRLVRFSIPDGAIEAVASLTVYLVGRANAGTTLIEARSAATITLLGVGLVILLRLTGSLPPWRWALVATMAASILAVLVIPALSELFELDMPPVDTWVFMGCVVAAAAVALRFVPVTADGGDVPEPPPGTTRAARTVDDAAET